MSEPVVVKKPNTSHISFTSNRRFGVELEYNSFDGLNRPAKGDRPHGIDEFASIVCQASPEAGCEIRAYEHTNNNKRWVAKPDSSCGLEVVSPPRKGWKGLKDVLCVVDALAADKRVNADQRCSVHIHVEIDDLSESELASVIAWWVKCEPVIMDAMPLSRKRNRYCQFVGMNSTFQHDGVYSDQDIIHRVGDVKYYSVNTNQYVKGGRKTIEFRTIEGAGSKDAYLVKQWVRFIIHFLETTAKLGRPTQYSEPKTDQERREVTPWTGLLWLDTNEVLNLLGFNKTPSLIPNHRKLTEFTLSKGMQQTRDWFVARLFKYMSRHKTGGLRHYAFQQLSEFIAQEYPNGDYNPDKYLSPTELLQEQIFGDDYRF